MSVHKETITQLTTWKDNYKNTVGKHPMETESIILDLNDVLLLMNEINMYNSSPASKTDPINALQLHFVRQDSASFLTLTNGEKQVNIVVSALTNYDSSTNGSGNLYIDQSSGLVPTIYAVEGGENGGLCPPKNHGL